MANFNLTSLDAYGHLWLAVLRQAVDDATMAGRAGDARFRRRRARAWLNSPSVAVGSLKWICACLGFETADRVLAELRSRSSKGGHKRKRAVT